MFGFIIIGILFLFLIFYCQNDKMFKYIYTLNTASLLFFLIALQQCFFDCLHPQADTGTTLIIPWFIALYTLFAFARAFMKISIWDKIIPFLFTICILMWSTDVFSGAPLLQAMGNCLTPVVFFMIIITFYIKTIKSQHVEHKPYFNPLKWYERGEHLMKAIPILGSIHHAVIKVIWNWCKRQGLFIDLKPTPPEELDKIKKHSVYMYLGAVFFIFAGIGKLYNLEIFYGIVFCVTAFILYALSSVIIEVAKFHPKQESKQISAAKMRELEQIRQQVNHRGWMLMKWFSIFMVGMVLLFHPSWNEMNLPTKQKWIIRGFMLCGFIILYIVSTALFHLFHPMGRVHRSAMQNGSYSARKMLPYNTNKYDSKSRRSTTVKSK